MIVCMPKRIAPLARFLPLSPTASAPDPRNPAPRNVSEKLTISYKRAFRPFTVHGCLIVARDAP
ncbi:hypothetical protein NOV72_04138 [Caballeronia novacaledonica]|uniref:Uncharacterized protein n=1 Tax=Caballeronia novacaledonica TaxID=1544861 RepID=A0A2U3I9V8_9BURK|nr:hypothetical protein [Caballeronia novacaledonica]SPB16938.1 hypothetical protein NOV72_04138 [Caballeronia novacaledonica]